MKRLDTTPRRSAFTLIELLVVIAIIAILASLLLAAVMRAFTVVKDVQNRNEIGQLAAAVASFKQTFKVDYMPSSFDPTTPQGQFYMTRLYPLAPPNWAPGALQGHQCLVFFLGGYQSTSGFSSNPASPMSPPQPGEIRQGPFFSFQMNRLLANGGYADVYGSAFAYFSTSGSVNSYSAGDCSTLTGLKGGTPTPYYYSPGNYLQPDSFQIISAGKDGIFGPGGPYAPGMTGPAADDITNFAQTRLGAPQQ